ncbi:MAG: hypothetical protein PHI59_08130 [Candidatus Omnitrophica bacterium]|nr:hypothetical protein [Candidatus Omnitrophota bacterium]
MIKAVTVMAVMITVCAVMVLPCCGFEDLDDPNLRIFDGNVDSVDVSKSALTVMSGETRIVFPVSLDTKLIKDTYDIKLSDISAGDYVTVEYLRAGSESRAPLKVTKVTLVYDASSR